MRICIFAGTFPKLSETFVLDQAVYLAEMGNSVTVICSHHDKNFASGRIGTVFDNITVHTWPSIKVAELRLLPWRFRERLSRFLNSRLLRKFNTADVWVAQFGWEGIHLTSYSDVNLTTPPIVTIFHGYDVGVERKKNGLKVYERCFDKSAGLITVNQTFRQNLVEAGAAPEKSACVHLGIPLNAYKFGQTQRSGALKLISVCRLVEKKGIATAVAALAVLKERRPDISFTYTIGGDGPLMDSLKDQVSAVELNDRVIFRGPLSHKQTLEAIAAADVLMAPSQEAEDGDVEGIPVTIMEAMAVGTIVCSTRHSGIPELVDDQISGLLTAEGDANGLALNLEWLADNREQWPRIQVAARHKVENDFDQVKQNAEFLSTVERLCKAARR
ncbi:glycosyltransferase [Asticcacaulis sp. DXS10W]|uniref:Glycosyltransferase n=1 Tax=Asticcacaulis currens TaxID=2984210 RepID=A0ABT5I9K4_9CAUL|nr:glycosyltransferase [Asticcacaulis currens]MDC7692789.1 glycosyltransferase [Asticcacaulis currens]